MIDAIYKLLQLDYPVIIIGSIDGNGATEIITVCIVSNETEDVIQWFISNYEKHNKTACSKIKCCMSDKDKSLEK